MDEQAITADRLIGTWSLVGATATDRDGRPKRSVWGPTPMGRIVLTESGRMMAVLCDGRTAMPAGEKRAYSSYCGNYRVENGTLVTTVDAASAADRIGGEQRRRLSFRDGHLVIAPPPEPDGEQRELLWAPSGPA